MPLPTEAFKVADAAYTETLVELRLKEGGGFKVASQQRRALEAALNAAAPFIQAQTLEIVAQEEEVRQLTLQDTMEKLAGLPKAERNMDDVARYGAYASSAQVAAGRYRRAAAALKAGK